MTPRSALRSLLALLLFIGGCTAHSRPPVSPPGAPHWGFGLYVFDRETLNPIPGATVQILDGVDAGTTAAVDQTGNHVWPSLTQGGFTACAAADGYEQACIGITLTRSQHQQIALVRARPPTTGGGSVAAGAWSYGRIGIRGRNFVDGTGHRFLIKGASLLTALHDGSDYHDLLDYYASKGINVIRTFGGALEWRNTRAAAARSRAEQFVIDCRAKGIGVIFAAITDSGWDNYNLEEHIDFYAALAQKYDNVVAIEIANEFYHSSQRSAVHDVSTLKALASRVPSTIIVSLSAALDDESLEAAGGRYVPIHLDRGRDRMNEVRRVRESENVEATTGKPAIIGESTKIGSLSEEGKFENRPNWWFAFGFLARGFQIDWIIHSEFGLQSRMPSATEQHCFDEALRGYTSIIGPDGDVGFANATWAGSPVITANFDKTVVRVYSFLEGDRRGHSIAIGTTGDPGVQWGNGWAPVGAPIYQDADFRIWEIRR